MAQVSQLATQVSQLAGNLTLWSASHKSLCLSGRNAALQNGDAFGAGGDPSAFQPYRVDVSGGAADLMRARTEADFWREKAELLQRELFREKLEAAHLREAELGLGSALRELRRQVEACCSALGTASGTVAYDLASGTQDRDGLASVSAVQEVTRAMHWAACTAKRLPQAPLSSSGDSAGATRAAPQQSGLKAHSIPVDDKNFCSPRNSLTDAVVASEMEDVAGPMLGSAMLQRRLSHHRRGSSTGSWGSVEEATQATDGCGGIASPTADAPRPAHANNSEPSQASGGGGDAGICRKHLEHTYSSPESITSLLEEGATDQFRTTPAPFTPASLPRHRRSISANPNSDGPAKTTLTKLIVSGAAINGVKLIAKGVQRGGKRCLFQWNVLPQGANEWQPVRSARRPELRTTLADIGAKFRCDATPVADDGSHGAVRSAYSQPIALNELSGSDARQARRRDGSFRFLVGLKDGESGGDMRAVLVLSEREFSVYVVGREFEEGLVLENGPLGVRILCNPLPDPEVGKSARPHVVMVVERSSACFKLGASRRGQLLEAASPEEQERIGFAVKTLYPSALLLANDYRSAELSLISPRPAMRTSPQQTQEGEEWTGQQSCATEGPRKVQSIPASGDSPNSDTRERPLVWSPAATQLAPSTKKAASFASPATQNHTPSPRTPVLHPQGRGQLSADDVHQLSAGVGSGQHSGDLSPDSLDGAWRRVQSASQAGRGGRYAAHNSASADPRHVIPMEHDRVAELQQRDASGSSGQSFTDLGSQRAGSVGRTVSAMTLEEFPSPYNMVKAKSDSFGLTAPQPAQRVGRQTDSQVSPVSSRHSTRPSTDYGSACLPTVHNLYLEGRALVGCTVSARGYTIEPVFQWQRILTLGSGGTSEGPTHSGKDRQGSLEVQSIPGATDASYQITPDDLHAIIRVCCIPQDALGLKGLTTYACLTESKPVELPPDLESEITTYKNLGTANFQVKRGDAGSDTITLHLDAKACYLKSKTGRVLAKEKYSPGRISVHIPSQPGKATVAINRPAVAQAVTWDLMFNSQHERDAAVLLIRSFGDTQRQASSRKKSFFSSFSSNGAAKKKNGQH